MLKRWRRRLLRLFAIIERPTAWGMLFAGVIVFGSVITGLIVVGEAKLATLLIAADLIVSGFSAVQESEEDEDPAPVRCRTLSLIRRRVDQDPPGHAVIPEVCL